MDTCPTCGSGLSSRILHLMHRKNCETVKDLLSYSVKDLVNENGVGNITMGELIRVLMTIEAAESPAKQKDPA